jgi:hypothetical protein
MTRPRNDLASSFLLALAAACPLAACAGGGGGGITVRKTDVSVAASTPVAISGKNLAFLADEATTGAGGTDMNGDTDKIDSIAVVVDMSRKVQTNLGVAATALAWTGNELYLFVDEALDGRNWEPIDTGNKLVLLHWAAGPASAPPPVPTFVDLVATAGATKMVAVGTNLFYSRARAATLPMESNLQVIESSDPLVPIPIATQDAGGPLGPQILGKDEGLIFLALDETAEGRDLNGDTDMLDTSVLALLDGTQTTNAIRSTGLATPAAGSPLRAKRTTASSHDWQVGFLVSEADQGATNLNDPALFSATWQPVQCAGFADVDATDDILHFLSFALWDTDPIVNPPVNTGLVGSRKIAIVKTSVSPFPYYIATITPEFGAGGTSAEGTCDLNGDGDTLDHVARWVQMRTPVLPLNSAANIHALFDVPGGTHGLAELQDRFVIEVSESEDNLDLNGDALKTFELVGWLSPSGSGSANTPWDFTHGSANSSFVGGSWIAEQLDRKHLDVALEEKVAGININAHVPPIAGEDTDILDSVPTFAEFASSPSRLVFPGVAIAVKKNDAGIVIAHNFAFYRVSEAEDSRDWNSDGLETGFILFRTSLIDGTSARMGPLNSIPGRPAIDVNLEETPLGAAFIADEQLQGPAGTDLNGDGDANDLVLEYFHF